MERKNGIDPRSKSGQTRERIINAARRLFRERDYARVGIRDIAAEAEVSASVFYYYFKVKKDVLTACFERNDDRFGAELEKILCAENDVCERIQRFMVRVMASTVQADGKELTRYRMFELKQSSQPDSMLCRKLESAVQHAQQVGELTAQVPAAVITSHILTVFRGATYEWCIAEGDEPLAALAAASIGFALRAFRA